MKKETLLTLMAIVIVITSNSCSDWQNLATMEFGSENLQKACENSKGRYDSERKRCVCDKECDDGVICVKNDSKSNDNSPEYICAGHTGDSFEKMCVSSGGKLVNGNCFCGNTECDYGVICHLNIHKENDCANHLGACTEQDSGMSKCNDNIIYTCGLGENGYEWYRDNENINKCEGDELTNVSCQNSDEKCSDDGKFAYTCDKNTAFRSTFCQHGCYAPDNIPQCDNIKEDSTICNGLNIMQYKDHTWNRAQLCSNKCAEINGVAKCIECEPNSTRCTSDNSGHEFVQTCQNSIWVNDADCGLNSCIKIDEEARCGECKTGTSKCENVSDEKLKTQHGMKSTCNDGKWSAASPCESGNSCNADNTDCGVCQNNIDKTCKDDNNIGYTVTCKDGSFENGEKVICPGSTSCKLDTENYELCNQPTGCDCGTNPTNHCLPSQYCTPIQYVCSNEPDENSKQCLTEGGCVCGNINQVCQLNQFCNKVITDKHCVDGLEVKQQPDNWVCGDCKNSYSEDIQPTSCGDGYLVNDCEAGVLTSMNSGILSSCLRNDNIKEIETCIKMAFEYGCNLMNLRDITKFENCTSVVNLCSNNISSTYERFKNCSSTDQQLYLYLKPEFGVVECKNGPCPCESSENPTGKKCETGQFCYQNKDCINNEDLAIGRLIKCNNPPCELCVCNTPDCTCECGAEKCKAGLVCSGKSNKTCNYVSEMAVVYVSECQDDECSCGAVKCNNGQYCQRDNKGQFKGCIDKSDINQYVQVYEFKDSLGYFCYSNYEKNIKLINIVTQCVNDSTASNQPYNHCFEAILNELESFSTLSSYTLENVCTIAENEPGQTCTFVCENGRMKPKNYNKLCEDGQD